MCFTPHLDKMCGLLGICLVVVSILVNNLSDFYLQFPDGTTADVSCKWNKICLGSCETYNHCEKLPNLYLSNKDCAATKYAGYLYLAACICALIIGCVTFMSQCIINNCCCVSLFSFINKYAHLFYVCCAISCLAAPAIFLYYGDKGAQCWDKNHGYDWSIGASLHILFITAVIFSLSAVLSLHLASNHAKNIKAIHAHQVQLLQNEANVNEGSNVKQISFYFVFCDLFWLVFGGGFIMLCFWLLFALFATMYNYPNSTHLFRISASLVAPSIIYADCKTKHITIYGKISWVLWVFPFGIILEVCHFALTIVYLPLYCCGCSWFEYHWRSISNVFNPRNKLTINKNVHKFNFYTHSYQIVENVHNLSDKVCIITGCNTGIGKETAKQLFAKGMIVVMACRNEVKANNARKDIIQEFSEINPNNLIFIHLDLADLQSIDAFVSTYNSTPMIKDRLDYLIQNAGVMAFPEFGTTKDGLERQFGINHIGHFYVVNRLLPIIKQNKTRIINVSSCAHYLFPSAKDITDFLNSKHLRGPTPDIIDYNFGGFRYYGISKLCNVLFTRQLNKLYNEFGVVALCLHPGNIMSTNLMRNMTPNIGSIWGAMTFDAMDELSKQKNIPRGAATTLRCVTVTNEEIFGGKFNDIGNMMLYFDDCIARNDKLHKEFINGKNTEIDDALWDYSCKILQSLDYLQLT